MANKRLIQLPTTTTIASGDSVYIVKGGVSYQISPYDLFRDGISDFVISTGAANLYGIVNPESAVAANPGSTYLNTANQTFWAKKDTASNTGWLQLI